MRQLFFSLFIYNYIELIASYRLLLGDFTTSCSQKDQDPSNLQSNKRNSIHTDNFFEQFKLLHEQCQTFCFSFSKQAVKIEIEHSAGEKQKYQIDKIVTKFRNVTSAVFQRDVAIKTFQTTSPHTI